MRAKVRLKGFGLASRERVKRDSTKRRAREDLDRYRARTVLVGVFTLMLGISR